MERSGKLKVLTAQSFQCESIEHKLEKMEQKHFGAKTKNTFLHVINSFIFLLLHRRRRRRHLLSCSASKSMSLTRNKEKFLSKSRILLFRRLLETKFKVCQIRFKKLSHSKVICKTSKPQQKKRKHGDLVLDRKTSNLEILWERNSGKRKREECQEPKTFPGQKKLEFIGYSSGRGKLLLLSSA